MRYPLPLLILCLGLTASVATADIPARPTRSLGAFITPIDAWASSAQTEAGRTARKLIDGSGWGETFPGSGIYVHANDVSADGNCMWNGDPNSWLVFDLGKTCRVNGVYVWNYNEDGGWNSRGVKEAAVLTSADGKQFQPVGTYTLAEASGQDDDPGQAVAFHSPASGRYFKFQILSNYRGGENSGLAEVRFSSADAKPTAAGAATRKPQYARPRYPHRPLGRPLPGAENIVYPADAGVVDVTKAPYSPKAMAQRTTQRPFKRRSTTTPARGRSFICRTAFIPSRTPCTGRMAATPAGKSAKPCFRVRAKPGRLFNCGTTAPVSAARAIQKRRFGRACAPPSGSAMNSTT